MNEPLSEQEKLARLLDDDFDPNDTGSMIAESLKNSLGEIDAGVYSRVLEEQTSQDNLPRYHNIERTATKVDYSHVKSETFLINIFTVYDNLVELFQKLGMENDHSDQVIKSIWLLEKCIKEAGGEVEHFVPEDFLSGLSSPDDTINANKVIETTKKYYSLGNISDETISDDGKTINIQFHGKKGNIKYVANGEIFAENGWLGNEAIDYIYNSEGGKMTVKAYINGKWSIQKDYEVRWELNEYEPETDISDDEMKASQEAFLPPVVASENDDADGEEEL